MSGALLKHPLKPNELADDLESFVHVLCFMALCFQAHDLSPHGQSNSENLSLAQFVKSYFFETAVYDRFTIGGFRKFCDISLGHPSFVLDNHQGPLATLINELYKVLKLHYSVSDWSAWSVFAAMGTQNIPSAPSPSLRTTEAPIFHDPHRETALPMANTRSLPASSHTQPVQGASAQVSPSAETQESSSPTAVTFPLADHVEMKLVFRAAMQMPSYVDDKTPNQFTGLRDPDVITPDVTGENTMSISSTSRDSDGVL